MASIAYKLDVCRQAAVAEVAQNRLDQLVRRGDYGRERKFRLQWWFVSRINAREIDEETLSRLAVKAFGVSALALLQRRVHEDFEEFTFGKQFARHLALGAEWRNEGYNYDQAGFHHQLGNLRYAPNILNAVSIREAKVAA
jgi:hypothetical protein